MPRVDIMPEISPHINIYRQFIEDLPMAAYVFDEEGNVQYFNRKATELFGLAPVPGQGKWSAFWNVRSGYGMLPDENVLSAEGLSALDIPLDRPDGSRRYVRIYQRSISAEDGQRSYRVHMVTDITEGRSNEEKTMLLAAIVQSSEDAIISKTLEGVITSWNEAATRIFGYTAEEMIGQPVTKLIPLDRLDEEPVIIERLKRGERVEHFETQRMTKYKRLIDISLTISPVKDSAGNVVGASKIARDICEQKNTARLIREREELFRMAVASTNIGSWEFSPDTGRITWSDESRKIWGIDYNTALTVPFLQSLVFEGDRELLKRKALQMAAGQEGRFDAQFRIDRADTGDLRRIKVQGKALFSEKQEPKRFIGTMLDITADKTFTERLEQIVNERTRELIELNQQLKRSNDELGQFAYIASHDLQEPVRKVQTFAGLIERHLHEPRLLEHYTRRIKAASGRISKLLRGVLDYSRLSNLAGRVQDVDLNLVLEEVLNALRPEMERLQAVVRSGELPVIKGNPDQLYHLFHNLISNSLKFCTKPPVITIAVSRLHHRQVEIVFSDNGIGFEQQYAEKIFHIFSHLNPVDQYNGTGIGLALCRKIVENHGGMISATGIPGEGASFYITLPAR